MLSREDNHLLCATGPGTTMGRYMRRFWIPAMTAQEIPAADEAPRRLRLLGEDLVVFRDTQGRVGVLEEHCPHRGASLYFGRNEEGGIRCVYHGWKFGVDGACQDMPTEPAGSPMCSRMRAVARTAREAGGLLWVFFGPADRAPALPGFEWMGLGADRLYASRWQQDCNYAQAMEGELDGAHVGFLHRRVDQLDADKQALTGSFFLEDTAPRWSILDNPAGFAAANARKVEGGTRHYWRFNQFVLPFYTMIPPRPDDARLTRMWVPMDDHHCWVICVTFRPDQPLRADELQAWREGENSHRKVIPGTTVPTERLDNEYLIDRRQQKTVSFTGIAGIRAQDAMVAETAGPIADRTREHLGSSDRAVVAMRRKLIDDARAHAESEAPPPAVADPSLYAVRAVQAVLGIDVAPADSPELAEGLKAPRA